MWNKSISLVNGYDEVLDDSGFIANKKPILLEHIPSNQRDTTRDDQILANQFNYKAETIFEIMNCNYSGQSELIDEETGIVYDIKRTYKHMKKKVVQLTCQRRDLNG